MGKRKYEERSLADDPNWSRASDLADDIQDLIRQIQILDITIARMQKDKAEAEFNGRQVNPFFSKMFSITKKKDKDEYYLEPSSYYSEQQIKVSEAELIMLREFKNQRLNDLNEEVRNLSNKINLLEDAKKGDVDDD